MLNAFERNMIQLYGDKGSAWLQDLPQRVIKQSVLWGLSELTPYKNLTYHYVASGFQDKQPIILKLGYDDTTLQQEAKALEAFEGFGTARVLAKAPGALLIERAMPGTPLISLFPHKDREAITIACAMIERLHQAPLPPPGQFPLLTDWLSILDKDWPLPKDYLGKARQFKSRLIQNSAQPVLLHGDLHQDNILKNGEAWIIIDPKGVIGDPIVDMIGCLIREPVSQFLQQPNRTQILETRLEIIARCFHHDPQILLQWTFVQSVMACCWSLEDNHEPMFFYEFIDIFMEQLK